MELWFTLSGDVVAVLLILLKVLIASLTNSPQAARGRGVAARLGGGSGSGAAAEQDASHGGGMAVE
uniref:Uncharacterized protein n=2 Tax=Oryza sativa subsp. japonica TaxID=39947 RepID=A0A5S6RCM1_ORYSJ|nr:Unknown protein [Oryza sativa]AAP52410.1 hypothetical protein LOC_Os10g09780 [Oryza sativa Japonica Group]